MLSSNVLWRLSTTIAMIFSFRRAAATSYRCTHWQSVWIEGISFRIISQRVLAFFLFQVICEYSADPPTPCEGFGDSNEMETYKELFGSPFCFLSSILFVWSWIYSSNFNVDLMACDDYRLSSFPFYDQLLNFPYIHRLSHRQSLPYSRQRRGGFWRQMTNEILDVMEVHPPSGIRIHESSNDVTSCSKKIDAI